MVSWPRRYNIYQHRIAFDVVGSEGALDLTPPSSVNSNLCCNSYVSNIDFSPGAAGVTRMCVGVMVAPGLNNGMLGHP
jgi:hypothetical protein